MLTALIAAIGWTFWLLALIGSGYTVMAAVFVLRFFRPRRRSEAAGGHADESVTLLKPLHGGEPGLRENLQTHLSQDTLARVDVVFGVQDPRDSAVGIARLLIDAGAAPTAILRHDDRHHGHNRKISNIINMFESATGDVIVLTDSDIGVPPQHLNQVLAALREPDVGVVTCPYYGKGETGFWSRFAAMGVTYGFLPNVITGVSLGLAKPCMGSTIALRRETLARIGGFEVFRDSLADDYAIGAAVRSLGLKSVVAPVLVSHSCSEADFSALVRQELRWARTIKGVDFAGHAGSIVTHPLALALIAAPLLGFSTAVLAALAISLLARLALMAATDRVTGRANGAWWLAPARDAVSFAVFVASFFARQVHWRGRRFRVTADGELVPV